MLNPTNRKLLQEQELTVKRIKEILQGTFLQILKMQEVLQAIEQQNHHFISARNRMLYRKIQKILNQTGSKINVTIINAIDEVWHQADGEYLDKLKDHYSPEDKAQFEELKSIRDKAVNHQRSIVKNAEKYLNQKRGGSTASQRIWKTLGSIPTEIDIIVQNAIKEGADAPDLAKSLQKYLIEPERLYRRVRNHKTGKLEWSKAAQEYHPGQGVYRSSYKNALRLARTEINNAYRYAEWLKIQNDPLALGLEIRSSRQENTCPICLELEGVYPKWFKWTGWHPQCMCFLLSVRLPREEFLNRTKLKAQGRLHEYEAPEPIKILPENFLNWLSENQSRIDNAASLPYWYSDNINQIQRL